MCENTAKYSVGISEGSEKTEDKVTQVCISIWASNGQDDDAPTYQSSIYALWIRKGCILRHKTELALDS